MRTMKTGKIFGVMILISAPLGYPLASRIAPVRSLQTRETQKGNPERIRIAEGEYRTYRQTADGGIGPFNPAIHDFAEVWTLWRLLDGSLQIEGDRTYEAEYERHKDGFSVHLSAQFTVLQITEYEKLRWRPDSGPLSCDFLPKVLDCNSGARDPKQGVRLRLPLQAPYGFVWPISAFSMSNITRFVDRKAGSVIPVSMLTIDEPGPDDPVMASVLEGKLRYMGREQTTMTRYSLLCVYRAS